MSSLVACICVRTRSQKLSLAQLTIHQLWTCPFNGQEERGTHPRRMAASLRIFRRARGLGLRPRAYTSKQSLTHNFLEATVSSTRVHWHMN
jgi:hypothetical protein